MRQVKTEFSPLKEKKAAFVVYNGDEDCRLIKELESSENPLIIPLFMNCRTDNVELVSKSVPCGIQQSASLLVDIDVLEEREDIYSDDNGVWTQKVCKTKYFNIITSANNKVVGLTKVSREEEADITVRRSTYTNESCQAIHKLMVSIEYGREIKQWYPIVFLQYKYDGEEKPFEVMRHGNRKQAPGKPHVRTKMSTKHKASENLQVDSGPKRALFKTVKDVGGVLGAKNLGILPRNERQMK